MTPRFSLARTGTLDLPTLASRGLQPFAGQSVLIVGDLILDHYLWGAVERTTPEAPVPIVLHERDSWVPGGAANVAHNVLALGGVPRLVGVVGRDADGARFREILDAAGIASRGVLTLSERPTIVKTRVVSMGQQLLRIDREDTTPLAAAAAGRLLAAVGRELKKCRVVIFSDYGKGTLSPGLLASAIAAAHAAGALVLVDPKGRDYGRYRGADVLTPNQKEAALATGVAIRGEADLAEVARLLFRQCGLQALAVTRGPEGVAVMRRRGKVHAVPARAREVFDVTGAGDTFIATLGLGLAAGLPLEAAAAAANLAGGIAVGKFGVATVSPAELCAALDGAVPSTKIRTLHELKILAADHQTRGRRVVFTNGCFDLLHPGHIRFLHEARRQGDLLIVGLNTDRSVRALKGPGRPILAQGERAAILSALQVVDYVLFFDEPTPERLLRELRPDVLVKGHDTPEDGVVGREIVEGYGGQVCRLPALHPISGSALLETIRGGRAG